MKSSPRKFILPVFICLTVLLILTAVIRDLQKPEPVSLTSMKLNTVVSITLYDSRDSSLLRDCMELCDEYEQKFSRTLPDSEISRLNRGELHDSSLSSETYQLIQLGIQYAELSGGAFDPTIGSISSLWDFTSENPHAPSPEAVRAALPLVDFHKITLGDDSVRLPEGVQLDPGAIAKGFIADRLKEYLISRGVRSAAIDLGGNILCIGSRPDGKPFRIGVQLPFADHSQTAGILQIDGKSVVTSGIYERFFEENGKFYHHILDTQTGWPCINDLLSVTIISDTSAEGDALSTACFALGLEKGLDLINSLQGREAIFIDQNQQLHFSNGFCTPFSPTESK